MASSLPQDGLTLLFIAAEKNFVDIIRLLLDKGADVNMANKV